MFERPGIHVHGRPSAASRGQGPDRHGDSRTIEGAGLLARALQHEIDHLDGHLFVHRLRGISRDLIRGRSRAGESREIVTA